jgi:hypothetical protein
MQTGFARIIRCTLAAATLAALAACETMPTDQPAPQTEAAAAPQGPPPCRALKAEPAPPKGWSYLPEISELCVADIFTSVTATDIGKGGKPKRVIDVHTNKDVGILVRPVTAPLDAKTTLRWSWNVEQLPSDVSEETAPKHDYLSIAVKFDNGQDLTYMWSAEMPAGHGFRCPLPSWDVRETHVVVRSGKADLGRWLHEKRDVLADYKKYVGGKPPKRITEVWLIANSIFQQGEGKARLANIAIVHGPKHHRVN